jgi:hypothetical protein
MLRPEFTGQFKKDYKLRRDLSRGFSAKRYDLQIVKKYRERQHFSLLLPFITYE